MSLRIVAGLPGTGASGRALAVAAAAATDGRSALLLVPSSRYAARLREAIATSAPVGLRAAGIKGVVESEWALKGDGRRLVNELQREVLLSRALVSAGVSERPGRGAVALLGTIATRVCAQGVDAEADASGLSRRLLMAVRGYLQALAVAGLVDEAEATRLLARAAPPADLVAVEGLVSLTPDREALLHGWSAAGCEVVISLPWEARVRGDTTSRRAGGAAGGRGAIHRGLGRRDDRCGEARAHRGPPLLRCGPHCRAGGGRSRCRARGRGGGAPDRGAGG